MMTPALSPQTQKLLNHLPALCNMVRRVAVRAGDATLEFYDESGSMAYDTKADGSPVTEADRVSETIIIAGLADIAADLPVITEEGASENTVPAFDPAGWYWLVDPLDGTRGFVEGSPDYTVNIALIHNGVPMVGIIYAPVSGELFAGCGPETALRWQAERGQDKPIQVRHPDERGVVVMESLHHRDAAKLESFLADFKVARRLRKGSSLKMCLIASGKADVYPRFGETCEWDTAAGDAILRAAGGCVVDLHGNPLTYGHAGRNFINPDFVASSGIWPFTDSEE